VVFTTNCSMLHYLSVELIFILMKGNWMQAMRSYMGYKLWDPKVSKLVIIKDVNFWWDNNTYRKPTW